MASITVHEMQYFGGKLVSDMEVVNYSEKYSIEDRDTSLDCFYILNMDREIETNPFYTKSDERKNKDHIYLLVKNEEIVGSVEIDNNEIDHLFVKKKYQRKGYREKLLYFAISRLQRQGIEEINLFVADLNKDDIEMYKNNNFKIVNTSIETL